MKLEYNNSILKNRRRQLRRDETPAESHLWKHLRRKKLAGLKFWRQYSVGLFIVDFYCPEKRLAVELDGNHHREKDTKVYDQERTEFLESKDIIVLRFWNDDIFQNLNGVLKKISQVAQNNA
jgi:very-short-patch-repair endonuclease